MLTGIITSQASVVIRRGGTIGYPTEGVFGLGCLPDQKAAIRRILKIKQRRAAAGLILLSATRELLDGWVSDEDLELLPEPAPADTPVTWIAKRGSLAGPLVTGGRPTIAVRISRHPIASSISRHADSPIVSTSANRAGHRPAQTLLQLRCWFGAEVDMIVPGALGGLDRATEIRVLATGEVLRPGG